MSKMATRESYGRALAEFGSDLRIVVFDADLSKSTYTAKFKEVYPERHFNMGIAEANMVSAACGMATCGKVAFVSTFAMFAAERACEQIRNSACYPNLDVKICASHAGITVGEDGASHQCLEDIAIMRALPNMRVVCPADAATARLAVRAAIDTKGPFYIRLGRLAVNSIYGDYGDDAEFVLGRAITAREGSDCCIIAAGLMVGTALEAAEILSGEGLSVRVLDMHTIKPIDADAVIRAAKETGCIITAEEHSVVGGLGSAVCEVLSENYPCTVKRFGIKDVFGKSGTPAALLADFGLTSADLAAECRKSVAAKAAGKVC